MSFKKSKSEKKAVAAQKAAESKVLDAGKWASKEIGDLAPRLQHSVEAGAAALAHAGTVAVLLPGAFYTLRETRKPPIEALRRHGARMALATDCNPGTSPLTSLLLAQVLLDSGLPAGVLNVIPTTSAAQTTEPPAARARSATGTSSPAGAKMIAASSSSASSSAPPAHSAPSSRASACLSASPGLVIAKTRRPWWAATWQIRCADAPKP